MIETNFKTEVGIELRLARLFFNDLIIESISRALQGLKRKNYSNYYLRKKDGYNFHG